MTITELDDIIKECYPQLKFRDLNPILKQFRSVLNKILVDYNNFRKSIREFLNTKQINILKQPEEKKITQSKL